MRVAGQTRGLWELASVSILLATRHLGGNILAD